MERRTVWIIVVVVLLLLCCCAVTVAGVGVGLGFLPWRYERSWNFDLDDLNLDDLDAWGTEATATTQESFVVEETSALVVECPVCNVQIGGRGGDTVDIEATKHAWSGSRSAAERQLDRITVDLSQQGNRVVVKVDMPQLREPGIGKRARVDLDITVPEQTDLRLDLDVGDMEIEGIEGQVDIQADVGLVELKNVVVRDSLRVRTDVARIRFEGPLGRGARYDMRSDIGDIAVTLPASSSFELDAESNVGAVTCDFAVRGQRERKDFVGGRIEGTVGESPTAELRLHSDVGSIRINED
jgi:hypothetical protein